MTATGAAPRYEPFGWVQWPDDLWLSYQFRRALGESQVGGGSIGETFLVASRMAAVDGESWHAEWLRVADASRERAERAEADGHLITARDAWLRATNQYRSAEFWLGWDDPRRLATFDRCEDAFRRAGRLFRPAIEQVSIPYENGAVLHGHLLRSPHGGERQPVLIAVGGLDSFKEELLFMVGRSCLERGIACLFVDGPGQGAALRRDGLVTRYDYEVPIGVCVDFLETRDDIDPTRIALSGSSLGGYYATRAGSLEHRLAAVVAHGAQWDLGAQWANRTEDHGLAMHIKAVFGTATVREAVERARDFKLADVIGQMSSPFLIVHGGHDVLGVQQATTLYDNAIANGVDATLRLVASEETGADHCQHDNPAVGLDIVGDWLADRFGIDQAALVG